MNVSYIYSGNSICQMIFFLANEQIRNRLSWKKLSMWSLRVYMMLHNQISQRKLNWHCCSWLVHKMYFSVCQTNEENLNSAFYYISINSEFTFNQKCKVIDIYHFQTDIQRKCSCIYVKILLFILTITHPSRLYFYIAYGIVAKIQNSLIGMCSNCLKGQRREEEMEYGGRGLGYIMWAMGTVPRPNKLQSATKIF